jgi:3-deoxy-D-manno-octulosonate 8-phosphate phosphatase (KDO 8-P phosphatase)
MDKKIETNSVPTHMIFDVDGVMTTGQFYYSENGKVYKVFGPHDSDGIKLIGKKIKVEFVTADKRGFSISKRRIVDDMNQSLTLVSEEDRKTYLDQKYGLKNIIYMGDGYYDAEILKLAKYGIAPNNARIEAKNNADFVTPSNSGEGAVLDAVLQVLSIFFKEHI